VLGCDTDIGPTAEKLRGITQRCAGRDPMTTVRASQMLKALVVPARNRNGDASECFPIAAEPQSKVERCASLR